VPSRRRRLSARRRLARPLEAELRLCGGEAVSGWIVDEQDDGLGMAFGAGDVGRLTAHRDCCVASEANLRFAGGDPGGRPIPVWVAHVTDGPTPGTCRAGLAFDVPRMCAEDISHLLAVWRRLMDARAG
jgi:hypothetical protein